MSGFKKKEYRQISCPLRYGECVLTEEFNKMIQTGWRIERTMTDHGDMCVRFLLSREVSGDG